MSCPEMPAVLNAWVDGCGAPEESAAVENHLASCADCRAEVRWLKAMKAAVAAAVVEAPVLPDELRTRLMVEARTAALRKAARLRREFYFEAWLRRWLGRRPLAGLGLAAAAAVVVALALRIAGDPATTVSIDDMLAAHRVYALTMPLANQETGLTSLADALARQQR